jgi:hypothetical protein
LTQACNPTQQERLRKEDLEVDPLPSRHKALDWIPNTGKINMFNSKVSSG